MDKVIKNVLQRIEENGREAYLVGGFVRDYLLNSVTYDVDICTNALPKDLLRIFPEANNYNDYGGCNIKVKKYNIDITTYRKEVAYKNGKPAEIIYVDNLLEDLKRRDFTINTLCMSSSGVIIDTLNAKPDIEKKCIRIVGDIDKKLTEDPTRILRAIRFAAVLNFGLDKDLSLGIKKHAKLVSGISGIKVKEEINRILLCNNFDLGIKLLKEYKLDKYLDLDFKSVKKCNDINLIWAQIKTSKIPFTKVEKNNMLAFQELIKKGKIDNFTLYKYGLYINTAYGEYIGIKSNVVSKMYKKLAIKHETDLKVSSLEIMDILNIKPSKKIKLIKEELINKILECKLYNNKRGIQRYLNSNKRKWQDE